MAVCCGRLSKLYVVLTNLLFACLGVAYVAFGVLGSRNKFPGATLFPDLIFKLSAVLGAIIVVASLFGFTAAFSKRRIFIYLYLLIILISLAVQVVIGVQVYKTSANSNQYILNFWSSASDNVRSSLQTEFSCCGYDGFKGGAANQCSTSLPPCADSLRSYVQNAFQKVYLITFAALAVQLLAISNAITMICSQHIHGDDQFEDERRQHRKSGIRLDDMTVDTPTTAGSYNQYGMHQPYEEQKGYYMDGSQNRYDSYDMYRHNNASYGYNNNNNNGGGYNQYHY
ncbi:Tetraspanin family-domain-containing protein [Absidia repens]|uniref:Tetraspanin family-domain-containing protein n=1 Tax=Absidia repens TaxID=90262 RepID=A0A1X2IPJ3_9FUNG|nr:Tetraspanin family-domain-containing protein [Absidia repens]